MRFFSITRLLYALLPLFALVFTGTVHAFKSGTNPATTSGNRTTFGTGTAGGGNLGDVPFTFASDGTLLSRGPVSFKNSAGARVDADLLSRIPKQSAARALGKFAMRNTPLLGAALALPELLKELGFTQKNTPNGMTLERTTTGGDAQWFNSNWGTQYLYPSGQAVCEAFMTEQNRYNPDPVHLQPKAKFTQYSPNDGGCENPLTGGGYGDFVRKLTTTRPLTQPATQQDLEDAIAQKSGWPSTSKFPEALREAIQSGETVEAVPKTLTGPATSPGTKTTTTNPNGSTTTTTTINNYDYSGPTVTVTTTTVTSTVNQDGTKAEPDKTTTTEPEKVEEEELKVCGLTTETACKIDEKGTKEKTELDPDKKVTDTLKQATDFARNPSSVLPQLPRLNWSFSLPTGCVAIALPAFAPFLQSIDVCQFLPMFHDIMSMVWIIGSLFGAISVFWRNVFSMG